MQSFQSEDVVADREDDRSGVSSVDYGPVQERYLDVADEVLTTMADCLGVRWPDEEAATIRHYLAATFQEVTRGKMGATDSQDPGRSADRVRRCFSPGASAGGHGPGHELVDGGPTVEFGSGVATMEWYEARACEWALAQAGGSVQRAARMLNIGRATLYRNIRRYDLGHLVVGHSRSQPASGE